MADFQYDFFMSRMEHIRDIKENDKIKISLVFYEGVQGPCIFKICKNRDLSDVCESLKNIRHPNIAVIYDYLYADNNTYIVEEYIEGSTIKELLAQKGCFSEKETIGIMQAVCNGLETLHKKKPPVIHNDINTSNIMIRQDGSVKLFDFDISRTYKEDVKQNTRLLGTEEYAAPEHYGYGQSEPRTDIYSLGVTMHEMLTGKCLDAQHKVTYKGKLKRIIEKCTKVDPIKRYASVTNVKKDLKKLHGIKFYWFLGILLFTVLLFIMTPSETEDTQTGEHKQQQANMGTSPPLENVISQEDNQETEKEDVADISVMETESALTSSKMSTICEVTGLFESMVARNDGTIVYLWRQDTYSRYLKDSQGQEILLNRLSGRGCRLGYDSNKDVLYLFEDCGGDVLLVYTVDNELHTEEIARIEYTAKDNRSLSEERMDVQFYSDGVVAISEYIPLIDTNSWTIVGESEDYDAIINDRDYFISLDSADEEGRGIREVDSSGETIAEVKIPDSIRTQSLEETPGYQNGESFYFFGVCDDKRMVYRFDGEEITQIISLDDYKYYSDVSVVDWCVTKDCIWIYDELTYTIKEFPLN